jgi:hypothetical protein
MPCTTIEHFPDMLCGTHTVYLRYNVSSANLIGNSPASLSMSKVAKAQIWRQRHMFGVLVRFAD